MSDDLVKRLRKVEGGNHYGATVWYKNPDGPEAADRIEKLETNFQNQLEWYLSNKRVLDDRIKKLEAALRPFAKWADAYDPEENDDDREAWDHAPTIGMLRAARKALEGKDG